jgi:hypothetical protein
MGEETSLVAWNEDLKKMVKGIMMSPKRKVKVDFFV